jgi:hypothetical protein
MKTDSKRAEEALRKSEERFRRISNGNREVMRDCVLSAGVSILAGYRLVTRAQIKNSRRGEIPAAEGWSYVVRPRTLAVLLPSRVLKPDFASLAGLVALWSFLTGVAFLADLALERATLGFCARTLAFLGGFGSSAELATCS